MKTLRRLIYGEVLSAVAFVTVGFLSLFFFFDFVEEIQSIGNHAAAGYQLVHAASYVTLMIPSHLYELLPIAVLIGTIFVMARLAQNSEYTILRTSGLGPWRALKTLLLLGLGFVLLTFAVGDYVAPLADRTGQLLKARYQGRITVGQTGAWLKEKQSDSQYAVNVNALESNGSMRDVRIFEFDSQGFLRSIMQAQSALHGEDNAWLLSRVERTEFPPRGTDTARIDRAQMDSFRWPNQISAEMVSAALLKPERMTSHRLEFFHKIKKEEQREKPEGDESHRRKHLAINQASDGFQVDVFRIKGTGAARGPWKMRQCQLLCPLTSQKVPNTRAPPCKASKNPLKESLPEAIQF